MIRIGVDVGGTNTDAVLMDGARVVAGVKAPTSTDVMGGVVEALKKVLDEAAMEAGTVDVVMIGTTHFVNAVVQRRDLAPTAAVRLCLPATACLPPMVDWPEDLRDTIGNHWWLAHGGHEFDGRKISGLDEDELRGIAAEIVEITLDDPVPAELDLYTLGGAEDYAQRLATKHLLRYPGLQQAVSRGAPVLAICAAIQVLGHWYETSAGERVDGVGVLDVTTSPQPERTIGEVAATPLIDGLTQPLTGFENHRGGTVLGLDARPLAAVSKGAGNRAGDGIDGAVQGSVVATYLHGCCLARNPELADHLLARVVGPLTPLEMPEVEQLRRERLAAPRRV